MDFHEAVDYQLVVDLLNHMQTICTLLQTNNRVPCQSIYVFLNALLTVQSTEGNIYSVANTHSLKYQSEN